jgi:hypothetical protein
MILLAEHTKILLDKTAKSSAHALLFAGPEGAGKAYAARYFAARKLGLANIDDLDKHPYVRIISPENNTISIEHIRNLQQFLRLKTPGSSPTRRIAIIEDAHYMTNEAQNALLKALEEPPADTMLILTAPQTLQLRETIYSRVQQIPILTITKDQAFAQFGDQFDQTHIEKIYTMSGGLAGLLFALLQDEEHNLVTQIQSAKEVLSAPIFNRLLKIDELSKQKEQLSTFFQACKLICSTALQQAATKGGKRQVEQWHKRLVAVHEAEAALPHNPNIKLLLTNLFLAL